MPAPWSPTEIDPPKDSDGCPASGSSSTAQCQLSPAFHFSRMPSKKARASLAPYPPSGVGTVVQRMVAGSRHCSTIAGRSASVCARSSTPASRSTRTGTASGNMGTSNRRPTAAFTTITEVTAACATFR